MAFAKNIEEAFERAAPMTELEAGFCGVEPAWANFLRFARTGLNLQYRGDRWNIKPLGPLGVHEALDECRKLFDSGCRAAAWDALLLCASHAVPMPFWLCDAVEEIGARLHEVPVSVHTLFGLSERHPTGTGRKAQGAAARLRWQQRIYTEATSLMAHDQSLGKTKAVELVIDRLRPQGLNFSRTTALQMFAEQDRIQQAYLKPYRRGKVVRKLDPNS